MHRYLRINRKLRICSRIFFRCNPELCTDAVLGDMPDEADRQVLILPVQTSDGSEVEPGPSSEPLSPEQPGPSRISNRRGEDLLMDDIMEEVATLKGKLWRFMRVNILIS